MKRKAIEMEMEDLCEDLLLFEILPNLPIKSVFRFKAVCTKWHSYISDNPTFITKQSQRCLATCSGIIYQSLFNKNLEFISTSTTADDSSLVGVPDPSLDFLGQSRQKVLLASTNGLLCGCIYPFYNSNQGYRVKFFVCNPVTQDFVYINNPNARFLAGLAFDPSSSSSQHYEIICPFRIDGTSTMHQHSLIPKEVGFEVFSSKTGIWRVSQTKLLLSNLKFSLMPIFAGGKLHWRVHEGIIWFDPREDRAGLVHSPGERKVHSPVEIGEWDGELSCTRITNTDIEIWVMRGGEYDTTGRFQFEWRKRYCVNLEEIFQHNWKVVAPFYHTMKLRSRNALDILTRRYGVTPLPFGSGEVLYFRMGKRWYDNGNVFKYNMRTKELQLCRRSVMLNWFLYNSSFVSLPKLIA